MPRLLDVLGYDRAPKPFFRLLVAPADPSDVQAAPKADQPDPQVQEHFRRGDLSRGRDREEQKRYREQRRSRGAEAASKRLRDGASDDAARLRFLAEQQSTSQSERKKRRYRQKKKGQSRGFTAGVFCRALPEAAPPPEQENDGNDPRREANQGIQGGRERRPEPSHPVSGRDGLARGEREEIRVFRIVRDEGKPCQNA